jgi:putative addiction module component (TIGR02574 family)
MKESADTILHQALELSASERSEIVEKLLSSLQEEDSALNAVWALEADARIEAFDRGDIDCIAAEEVFGKYRKS